ncbi:para-nitrobenzyl esterase-like [Epargyreus clarus]|uniref:para-nitrobenzyl esterase-like n=1 Tax=Epargyreus clarus TaxID=520877 RepID=UPI003C2B3478
MRIQLIQIKFLHKIYRTECFIHSKVVSVFSSVQRSHGSIKMRVLFLISLIYLVNNAHSTNIRIDPLVKIDQGLVRGIKSVEDGFSSFLGIPYAQVDMNNPFGQSLPHPGFEEEIYNAYDGSKKCPQAYVHPYVPRAARDSDETLDCLRLNIYVPNVASSQNPLPVLVWIHGGVFAIGSAGDYGVRNLVKKGIIVVTINYRLGPYGFMCLDVPSVPGNQGLKDQNAALRWIRENINSFGGNPYNVTIAGQSAGSSSVLLHLYSDKEKLFSKVIAESGVPQVDGMFVEGDNDAALKLAYHLGFNTTNTEEALSFLSKTSHTLVSGATSELQLELRPCVEKSFSGIENFVESDPYTLSNARKVRNTPIMIGHTTTEQAGSLDFGDDYFNRDIFREKLTRNFNMDDATLDSAAKIIRHFYIGDDPISQSLTTELENFESDFVFSHPIQRTITSLLNENANPVYAYEFSYVGNSEISRAAHSAELQYLFELSNSVDRNEDDQLITDRLTTMWANFVKNGNPTPTATDLCPVIWKPVTEDTRPYLVIDIDIRMENRITKERTAFWDLFYSLYGKYNKLSRDCDF